MEEKEIKKLFDNLHNKAMTFSGLEDNDPDIFKQIDNELYTNLKEKYFTSREFINELIEKGERLFVINNNEILHFNFT